MCVYSANTPYDKSITYVCILTSSAMITQRFHTYKYGHGVTNNSAVEYKTVCLFCIHVTSMAYVHSNAFGSNWSDSAVFARSVYIQMTKKVGALCKQHCSIKEYTFESGNFHNCGED